jgi:hypothetical protein
MAEIQIYHSAVEVPAHASIFGSMVPSSFVCECSLVTYNAPNICHPEQRSVSAWQKRGQSLTRDKGEETREHPELSSLNELPGIYYLNKIGRFV